METWPFLMSGSLRFVITACKAVCLWVVLLLRGKAGPHRYLGRRKAREGRKMKGREAEEREMEQGCDGDDSKQRPIKERGSEHQRHLMKRTLIQSSVILGFVLLVFSGCFWRRFMESVHWKNNV